MLVAVVLALIWWSSSRGGGNPAGQAAPTSTHTSVSGTNTTASPTAKVPKGWIAESQLPLEGRETLQLIRAGGPFPYPRNDGVTYFNRNGQLPAESRNYYKEYTVITPGSSTRGARRLVVGAGGEIYYTQDHYDTFRRVMEGR